MGLEEMIGLGVTISLVDAFSSGANQIGESMRAMEERVTGGSERVTAAISTMKVGLATMAAGVGIVAPIIHLGEEAVDTSARLTGMRNTVSALVGDSGQLAEELARIAENSGVFKESELLVAGKHLAGMGVEAARIPGMLTAASQAAAVLGESVDGVVQTFYGMQFALENKMPIGRMLKKLGLDMGDLQAEGIRASKGKVLSSVDDTLAAVERALGRRFGSRSGEIAQGMGALRTQIAESLEKGFDEAGKSGLIGVKKAILTGVWESIRDVAPTMGEAFGRGLVAFFNLLAPIGRGLKSMALALGEFLGKHPEIVRIGTSLAMLVGSALIAAGGVLALGGALQLLPLLIELIGPAIAGAMTTGLGAIASALPVLIAVGAIAYMVYEAWTKNLGGFRTMIMGWVDKIRDVVDGLWQLFSGDQITVALQGKLAGEGLWPFVQTVYLWGQRLADVVGAAWDTVKDTFTAFTDYVLPAAIVAFRAVGDAVLWLGGLFGSAGEDMRHAALSTDAGIQTFKNLGEIVGTVAVLYGGYATGVWAYQAAQIAATFATRAAAVAQWLFNAALMANPIVLVVAGVAALCGAVAALVVYWDDVALAAMRAWKWMKEAVGADTSGIDKSIAELETKVRRAEDAKNGIRPADEVTGWKAPLSGRMDFNAPAGSPTSEQRESASTTNIYQQQIAAAREGGAPQRGQLDPRNFHFYIDGRQVQAVVKERDDDVAGRDFGDAP